MRAPASSSTSLKPSAYTSGAGPEHAVCEEQPEAFHIASQLGADNFTSVFGALAPDQPCLVEFYASWCPACKHFAPTFEKLATFLKDKRFGTGRPLYIARVDCASEVKLCGEFELPGYPALYLGVAPLFAAKQHKQLRAYDGKRELRDLALWVGRYFNMTLAYAESPTAVSADGSKQANGVAEAGVAVARRPLPQGSEWSVADVEGATLQLWRIVTTTPLLHRGPEKRDALRDVLTVFAAAHPSASCKAGCARLVASYNTLWPPGIEDAPAALLSAEPCGPPAALVFDGNWVTCRGSKPDSRGYSCGLWQLLHTMALRLPESSGASAPAAAMMAFLLQFNKHFFLCEPCQKHFGRILTSPEASAVKDRRSLVLWLWRVHNEVNERLRSIEAKYGHSTTGDPVFPKEEWPALESCPRCKAGPPGSEQVWVEDEVYDYLVRAYGPNSAPGADGSSASAAGSGRRLELSLGSSRRGPASALPALLLPGVGVLAAAALLYGLLRSTSGRRRGHGGGSSGSR
ncbi:Sulfhydryl oxidase 1 [Tetrabaena socialis]|uniref:Sulfhydryl oxidase n=1 Tax=Tetrabaena socialis TaxID=47790 RepID=A0A2J8ADG3_9CHLO|nr:Sulfhydryl oxidase 1 [Tetrabaena socialis]|eukprot:PNH10555.1 Sulfhydryl oxidase 1 [Tetrabaena socialis]